MKWTKTGSGLDVGSEWKASPGKGLCSIIITLVDAKKVMYAINVRFWKVSDAWGTRKMIEIHRFLGTKRNLRDAKERGLIEIDRECDRLEGEISRVGNSAYNAIRNLPDKVRC